MQHSLQRSPRWIWAAFFILGVLTVGIWWRIRLLGDVRDHLGVFYGWFVAAFLLYLAAWWVVSRVEAAPRRPWPLVWILGWALVARLLLLGTPPHLSSDIYRYHWDGRVQHAGFDPYAYSPDDLALQSLRDEHVSQINFPSLRTVYPPLAELAFRLGAWLSPTLIGQKLVFLAAEAVTCAALLIILLARGMNPLWVVAYAWHPLAILEVAGSGHNDALGIAWLWVGLAAWHFRWRTAASLAWAAACLSKFMSVVLIPWWWFRREARGWLGLFLVTASLPIVLRPTLLSALHESLSAVSGRIESNSSVFLVLVGLLGSVSAARLATVSLSLMFLLWWARREPDPARYLFGGLLVMAGLSPVVHPWYLLWLVPFFVLWRVPAVIAWTATVVLAYAVWPGYVAHGVWVLPWWARAAEYAPVVVLGVWGLRRCAWSSSFRLATKPRLLVKS